MVLPDVQEIALKQYNALGLVFYTSIEIMKQYCTTGTTLRTAILHNAMLSNIPPWQQRFTRLSIVAPPPPGNYSF